MDAKRVIEASEVLSWMAEMSDLPDSPKKAVEMKMLLTMANIYLVGYAKRLVAGDDPYDALLKSARGDIALTESPSLTTLRLMSAKPAPDPTGDAK